MDKARPPNWEAGAVFASLRSGQGPEDPMEIAWLLQDAGFDQVTRDETDWPFRLYEHRPSRVTVWLQMDRTIDVGHASAIAEKVDLVWTP